MVEYRVTYLHLVLPLFVCIQKSSPFLKPRVSLELVPLNDFKSYHRTSETFQSIILLYKKRTCDSTDVLTLKCCFFVSLALISIHAMATVIILRSCVMKLNRFSVSFSSFSRSNQEVYVRILARRVLGL